MFTTVPFTQPLANFQPCVHHPHSFLLLAGDHEGAARRALAAAKPLLGKRPAQPQQLEPWLECLSSVSPAALPTWLWEEVFGTCLYIAALRAFGLGYLKVGAQMSM